MNNMEKKEIASKVSKLLKDFGYKDGEDIRIDICEYANSQNFQVGESKKLPFVEDGFISLKKYIIGVNSFRTIEEKRFIVAHELAHYFLHRERLENTIMLREHIKGKDEEENDADYFAACFLMPHNSFIKQYNLLKLNNDLTDSDIIDKLQIIFQTPRESIKRRIEEVSVLY